jgi:hypothetical protein
MSNRRLYVNVSDSHAPFMDARLQGLGAFPKWPVGRTYWDVSQFRQPYAQGYYQDGSLQGALGAPSPAIASAIDQNAPPDVKRFLLSGEPVPTTSRDISLPFNQVPRWGYAVLSVFALGVAYASYKRFKKGQRSSEGSST